MRSNDYPTGNENGMSFICNRWVFTGPEGYRVRPDGAGTFRVERYTACDSRPVYRATRLTEEAAHAMAASLSGRSIN